MKWILIFAFLSWHNGVGAISQEFNSKESCEFAMGELIKLSSVDSWDRTIVTCVPK